MRYLRFLYDKNGKKSMKNKIKIGKYRHYKGGMYEVIAIAHHSETLEDMVVYRALYGNFDVWVRPASMWFEKVTKDNKTVTRFKFVDE